MPPGTSCSKDLVSKSYCVMGKCLEFGKDMTPKYELSEENLSDIKKKITIKPRSLLRFKRELFIEPPKLVAVNQSSAIQEMVDEIMNVTHFNGSSIGEYTMKFLSARGRCLRLLRYQFQNEVLKTMVTFTCAVGRNVF